MLRKPALKKLPSPVAPTLAEASHDACADSLACAASCLSLALFKFLFGGCCFETGWQAVRIACKSAEVTKTCARFPPLGLTRNLPPACQIYLKPSPCAMNTVVWKANLSDLKWRQKQRAAFYFFSFRESKSAFHKIGAASFREISSIYVFSYFRVLTQFVQLSSII